MKIKPRKITFTRSRQEAKNTQVGGKETGLFGWVTGRDGLVFEYCIQPREHCPECLEATSCPAKPNRERQG